MADQGLYDKDTQITIADTDYVRINRVYTPNVSGREDYKILVSNLLSPERGLISANTASIAVESARITVLENGLTKSLDQSKNIPFEITQNADSRIISFGFRPVSGTCTVAIGTTLGADDIVDSWIITGSELAVDVSEYSLTARTLYVSINGGTIDLATFSRENLYEVS